LNNKSLKEENMTTLIIKPKSRDERIFLTKMLKKMNIEVDVVEEPSPNYETQKAINDVENNKGTRVKNASELFDKLGL
jgi:antitoxin component of RelBE/YafQ-DinJ toxin-antitoxin module